MIEMVIYTRQASLVMLSERQKQLAKYECGRIDEETLRKDEENGGCGLKSKHDSTHQKGIIKTLRKFPDQFAEVYGDLEYLNSAGYLSGEPTDETELEQMAGWLSYHDASDNEEYLQNLSDTDRKVIREIGESGTDFEWWNNWIRLLDCELRDNNIRLNPTTQPSPYQIGGWGLGKRFGRIITRLAPNSQELDRVRVDFVAGMIDELTRGLDSEGWDSFKTEITGVIENHPREARADRESREAANIAKTEATREASERIVDALNEMKIDHTPWLVWYNKECHKPRFRTRPAGYTDWSYQDTITSDSVRAVLEKYDLLTKQQLKTIVEEDTEKLDQSGYKSVPSLRGIIEAIYEHSEPRVPSTTIADAFQSSVNTGNVTKSARDLAGREWNPPLLNGDAGGWKLTACGRVFAETSVEPLLRTWYDFESHVPEDAWCNSEHVELALEGYDL
jgi:hypothetical protein